MPLSLFIMRHGIAEFGEGKADADRTLTAAGVTEVEALALGLIRRGIHFDAVLTSPLRRTLETGRVLCRALGGVDPEGCAAAAPGAAADAILAAAREALGGRTEGAVLVIGHMPDVSHLVTCLDAAGSQSPFAPATVARIDFDGQLRAGAGTLRWIAAAREIAAWR